jgi:hypothetical protein
LFPEPVDEEFHMSAPIADIHVEALAFDEQFANLAKGAPVRSLMEAPGSDMLKLLLAAKT